jgi:putative transcriptional regulator
MDNNLFDDLVASIKEAGAIKRNEMKASRVSELELPDIKEVLEKTGLTQAEFAARLHISVRTLQNWNKVIAIRLVLQRL